MGLQPILERLSKEILILDGSMGALLQARGLPPGYAPDLWNLENPKAIEAVHREYVEAGSDIILTNTFGANRPRLEEYKSEGKLKEINRAGVEIARRAAGNKAYVAGDVGPCGAIIAPFGELAFEKAVEIFYEQIRELVAAGADLIAVETIFDLQEIKAVLIAARQATQGKIPILAHMTFMQDGLTDTGTDPVTAAAVMEGLGANIVGANCSTGPQHMVGVIEKMGQGTACYLCAQPNAGLPVQKDGKTIFPASAQEVASYARKFADAGANIVGGCCGTTPEYIRLVSQSIKHVAPKPRTPSRGTVITSRTKTLIIGPGHPFVKIGEKINPTGKKKFSQAIAEGHVDVIIDEARRQFESGAMALDVNVGVPMIDEAVMMVRAVTAVQNVVDLPLVIDSASLGALEAGLAVYPGKALINSVDAQEEKMAVVLPLARKYGAALIAMVSGRDIPQRAQDRLQNARIILKRAEEFGLRREDILFDCLALTVSAAQEGVKETLETVRLIRQELGCSTILGVSNVSFGLPARSLIHNNFLAMAMGQGLDAAIVNPYDEAMHQTVAAASVFAGRDPECRRYISLMADVPQAGTGPEGTVKMAAGTAVKPAHAPKPAAAKDELWNAVIEGNREAVGPALHRCLDEGMEPVKIFSEVMTPAIRHLGDLFGQRKKFIPHLVAAADAMQQGAQILKPLIEKDGPPKPRGVILMATVQGDVHDIGKNICAVMLGNFGFKVVDLGKSVPADVILNSAREHKADIIGLSALMTTTMMQMKVVVDAVKQQGLPFKVVIGGAVTTQKFAQDIRADGYSRDVGEVVRVVESLLEKARK